MSDIVRRLPTGLFGTFHYDPVQDQYQFDEEARRILGDLARPGVRYVDMLACMPSAARRSYEQWRMEAVETGCAGRVRVPFRLPTREVILEVQVQRTRGGIGGMIADVTADEEEYREMLDQLLVMNFAERVARFGIWAYDIRDDSFTASAGAVALLMPGADPTTFTFERVLELVHQDDRAAVRTAYVQALHTGQVQHVEFRRADWPMRWFIIQFMRILDDAGDPVQTCGMIHETTDLHQRAELEARHEQLVGVQELRARFVNAAAHELSQPLTPLRLQLALLRHQLPDREDLLQGFQVIERNLERVGFILNDLLDAARSQAGHLRVQVGAVPVAEHVSHVVATLSGMAAQRSVVLDWAPTPTPPAWADPMRLQQCVSNLVHNAIKFTREGGRVTVRTGREGDQVVVRVEDEGPGLDEEQARRVFEPFEQVHRAPPGYGGTGLGLYVTRALMRAMGGTVEVESEPGRGACFRLCLRMASGAPEPAATEGDGGEQDKVFL